MGAFVWPQAYRQFNLYLCRGQPAYISSRQFLPAQLEGQVRRTQRPSYFAMLSRLSR